MRTYHSFGLSILILLLLGIQSFADPSQGKQSKKSNPEIQLSQLTVNLGNRETIFSLEKKGKQVFLAHKDSYHGGARYIVSAKDFEDMGSMLLAYPKEREILPPECSRKKMFLKITLLNKQEVNFGACIDSTSIANQYLRRMSNAFTLLMAKSEKL